MTDDEIIESVIIAEAVEKAKDVFKNHIEEEYGLDPAYWSLRIVVRHVGSDLHSFLKEQTFDDRGSYEHETE